MLNICVAEFDGGNIPVANKIVREEIEYDINHYGDYVIYTEELDLYDYDDIQDSFLDILGDQAGLTVDTIRRDTLRGSTNRIYVDGSIDRAEVATSGAKHTPRDFKQMAVKLKNQGAKKFKKVITATAKIGTKSIRSAFLGLVSPEVVEDLRELNGWKNVEDYSDYSKRVNEWEVGSWGDFRIMETTNNEPTDVDGVNVYESYFFGEDSYATVSLKGRGGIKTILKGLGKAGTDPLNTYGTIGWKTITGCAILNQAWLIVTECTADIEDGSEKHYLDYS